MHDSTKHDTHLEQCEFCGKTELEEGEFISGGGKITCSDCGGEEQPKNEPTEDEKDKTTTQAEPDLPPFEKQTEAITEMLNDMVDEKVVSRKAVVSIAMSIVCDNLSKLPRKDYKNQYRQIELVSKVMRAKAMNGER